jgi:uncharacterized protein YqgC (DUF456 family)
MDAVWFIIGILIMLAGLAGCVLPLLPGPPLCFVALLIQQLKDEPPFTGRFLWIWAGITVIVTALDYIIPVYGTKRFGGTRYGIWGCTIGLIVGLWFGPLGIVIGPFIGAFIGEMIANMDSNKALRAALGSFAGFLFGTLLKLIVCVVMLYYLVVSY